MTRPRRVDWLLIVFWLALGLAALAFACGLLWLAGQLWRAVWPVLWPWVQAHSDGLTIGLGIGIALGAVVALALEDKRR